MKHGRNDDQRSSHYDDLLSAENRAIKNKKGVHGKKETSMHRVADVSGVREGEEGGRERGGREGGRRSTEIYNYTCVGTSSIACTKEGHPHLIRLFQVKGHPHLIRFFSGKGSPILN